MNRRLGSLLLVVLLAVLLAAGVGTYAYNLGIARGLAVNAQGAPPLPPVPWHYAYGYGFFPFFPIFPVFFFILCWFVIARALFWRRSRYGGCCGGYDAGQPPAANAPKS